MSYEVYKLCIQKRYIKKIYKKDIQDIKDIQDVKKIDLSEKGKFNYYKGKVEVVYTNI